MNGYASDHSNGGRPRIHFPMYRNPTHYFEHSPNYIRPANPTPIIAGLSRLPVARAVDEAMNRLFQTAGEETPGTPGARELQQANIDNIMYDSCMTGEERRQFDICLRAYGWR